MDNSIEFSIIIPTRNRPALLKLAIESVIRQQFHSFEVIVVNDGSDEEHHAAYTQLEEEFKGKLRLLHLEKSLYGHGQSYPLNMGVKIAQGRYVGFLDDDDIWIDEHHLANAHIQFTENQADLYFTLQQAYSAGQPTGNKLWLSHLEDSLKSKHQKANAQGAYLVKVNDLMAINGFSHVNTTLICKTLFESIKGLDENIRYECDRDFYLRAIDNANSIIYNPIEISRHHIPDAKKADNMSTLVSDLEKMNYRLTFLNKMLFFAKHPDIIKHAKQHKAYTLKYIAESLSKRDKHEQAFFYAREALLIGYTIKWQIFTLFLAMKALIKK